MRTVVLADEQRQQLERMARSDPKAYRRERAAAILKVAAGQVAYRVARDGLLRPRDPDTVYAWLDRFEQDGVAGLTISPGRGRKPAFFRVPWLDRAGAQAELQHTVARDPRLVRPCPEPAHDGPRCRWPPREPDPPRSRWTLSDIQQVCAWLADHSRSGVWRVLRSLEIHWKRGRQHVHSPDPDYLAKLAYLAALQAAVRTAPSRALLLFQDEVTYYRQPTGCRAWLALVGALEPFRPAAAVLEELTGVGVGAETVRAHAEAAGGLLEVARSAAAAQVEAEREAVGPLDAAAGVLVVMADGLHLRWTDGWHEVKLGLVSGCAPGDPARGTPHVLLRPSYLAARASADEFGPLLLAEAAHRGALEVVGWEHAPAGEPPDPLVPDMAVLREVVVLGDGAPWIWRLADEHFGRRVEILDWYHASEHLWALGKALHGDGTPATAAWVAHAETALWEGGAAALLALLQPLEAPSPDAAEALRRERGYFTANASRLDYPAYRARGLPIGSGAVESAAKHLVQDRMKRAGMRWSLPGGQALLTLAAHLVNHHPRLRLTA